MENKVQFMPRVWAGNARSDPGRSLDSLPGCGFPLATLRCCIGVIGCRRLVAACIWWLVENLDGTLSWRSSSTVFTVVIT